MEDKQCPMCGAGASDEVAVCECGYRFANVTGDESVAVPAVALAPIKSRPTGEYPMMVGWLFLVLAFLAVWVWLVIPSYRPDQAFLAMVLGGAAFQLFLVFWGVGYIVNAISHLPGRE